MKVCHMATNEWMTLEELQKKLDEGFNFRCNECHEEIGNHVKTLAEGIFCVSCFNSILEGLSE